MLQRIEAMLKHIIPRSKIVGDLNTLKKSQDKSVESISQQTMGNLVKRFVETICKENEPDDNCLNESTSPFYFRFQVEMSKESLNAKREALECIVSERNNLIHHMLSSFNQNSTESCIELSKKLDEQNELIKSEFDYLKNLIMSFTECSKIALQEFENEFITKSRNSSNNKNA